MVELMHKGGKRKKKRCPRGRYKSGPMEGQCKCAHGARKDGSGCKKRRG